MRHTTLILCSLLVCSTQSLHLDLASMPFLLAIPFSVAIRSANGFTRGFFSMFRRSGQQATTSKPFLYEEYASAPSGPVSYPSQRNPYYQYGLGAEDMFSRYSRFAGFGNAFQGALPQPEAVRNPGVMAQGGQDRFEEYPYRDGRGEDAVRNPGVMAQGGQDRFEEYPYRGGRGEDATPSMNPEDAESFFTLLAETDEHQCISRLVCEMGASPETAGEFAQSVNEVFSTLQRFPPGSKVSHYKEILQLGSRNGLTACVGRFPSCDEQSYNLVKNAQLSED